jgi:hypothetical protein
VNSTICICCGEPLAVDGGLLSRDSNVCSSCSSIGDGMLDELVEATVMKIALDQENQGAADSVVQKKILTNPRS